MRERKNILNLMQRVAVIAIITALALFIAGCTSEQADQLSPGQESQLSPDEAKNKAIDYINANLVTPDAQVTAVSVEDKGSVYEIITLYKGREIPVYMSKDGKYLFFNALNLSEELPKITPTIQAVQTPALSEEELAEFIDCLNESGFKIYGAKWCGYCQQLVNMLGGYKMVEPIYIECTERQEECEKANVRAYPTIYINDSQYTGPRTLEAFSEVTGCPLGT